MFSKSKLDKKSNDKLVKKPNNESAKELGSSLAKDSDIEFKLAKELNDGLASKSNNDELIKERGKPQAKLKRPKLSKLWRVIVWLSRRLAILIFVFMVVVYASSAYLEKMEAKEAEVLRVQAYKEALMLMKPNTPTIDRKKELLLEAILSAEADSKITVSEYIAIERGYRGLEEDMMRVLAALKGAEQALNKE